MKIRVRDGDRTVELTAAAGENLLAVLRANGFGLSAACGGKGTCGKCKVRVCAGTFAGAKTDGYGCVLACRATVVGDAEIAVTGVAGGGLEDSFSVRPLPAGGRGFAVACDIGTTTLAAEAIDLASGAVLARTSRLNPQGAYGADVISRILACSEGHLGELREVIVGAVREMMEELAAACPEPLAVLTVAGNTTMQHLFVGVDPTPIGRFPFTPVFTETKSFAGREFGIPAARVIVLPAASGYFGADAAAGLYAVGMDEGARTRLFVDIGTNGEIALRVRDKLRCASTAAGPALEGACIECGVGGIAGAVDRVSAENGELIIRTVGGAAPIGICGCGLVDLVAELLRSGVIDETGALGARSPYANAHIEDGRFVFGDKLWLSQKDVRQFQLAKSAVHAGITALAHEAGITPADVDEVLVAGGLGYYLDVAHTLAAGILPRAFAGKIRIVGNTSLHGAALAAASEEAAREIAVLAKSCEIVELNESPVFSDAYMMGMMFDTEEL